MEGKERELSVEFELSICKRHSRGRSIFKKRWHFTMDLL
jgi:hypothetical protein